MISNQSFHVLRKTNHLLAAAADAFDIRKQIRAGDKILNLGILAGIVDNAHAQIQQFCAAFRLQADFAAAAFYIIDIVGNAEPVAQLGCCDAFEFALISVSARST